MTNTNAESVTFEAICQPPNNRTLTIPKWVCEKLRLQPGDLVNLTIEGFESSYKNFRTFNFIGTLKADGKVSFPSRMGMKVTISREYVL